MPYDIYGQPLRRGYCEVHPDVHQEYPCPCCVIEYNRHEQLKMMEEEHDRQMQEEYDAAMNNEYWSSQVMGDAESWAAWLACEEKKT